MVGVPQVVAGHVEIAVVEPGPGLAGGILPAGGVVPGWVHRVPLPLQAHQVPGVVAGGAVGGPHHRDALHPRQVHEQLERGGVPQADAVAPHQHAVGVGVVRPSLGRGVGVDRSVIAAQLQQGVMEGQLLFKVGHALGDMLGKERPAGGQDGGVLLAQAALIPALPGRQDGGGVVEGHIVLVGRVEGDEGADVQGGLRRRGGGGLRTGRGLRGRDGGGLRGGGGRFALRRGLRLRRRRALRRRQGLLPGRGGQEGLLRPRRVGAGQEGGITRRGHHPGLLQQSGLVGGVAEEVPGAALPVGLQGLGHGLGIVGLGQTEDDHLPGVHPGGQVHRPLGPLSLVNAADIAQIGVPLLPLQGLQPGGVRLAVQHGPGDLLHVHIVRRGALDGALRPGAGAQGQQEQQGRDQTLHGSSPSRRSRK